ncbi:ArsR/SmtB family transcription factor [Ruania albidiflava]|uniref:ArsR/SmtB family transcription factor n=1 Tax=Ruania albidiflava TaxID=366586 RepID=UPI0023F58512|nr:metalloregulator ArsR/SmtB family transcription factor [Ruania albidiflava]
MLSAPGRLRILDELLGGTPLPAGALAARLGLAPSTVSSHLSQLVGAGLISVEQAGRTRLARLANEGVADTVEALLRLSAESPISSLSGDRRRTAMRTARSCYDHLAGRVGTGLVDAGIQAGWLIAMDGGWRLRDSSVEAVEKSLQLPVSLVDSPRPLIRACTDWTERRPHMAGRLAKGLLDGVLADGWVRRRQGDRALALTAKGRERFSALGIEL